MADKLKVASKSLVTPIATLADFANMADSKWGIDGVFGFLAKSNGEPAECQISVFACLRAALGNACRRSNGEKELGQPAVDEGDGASLAPELSTMAIRLWSECFR